MTATIIVQARMGSSRLPGKVLRMLGGRPLLGLMIERLAPLGLDRVVIATSDRSTDDPIERFAVDHGLALVRGSEDDVLGRFCLAAERHPADHIVRLTGDCPLIDPQLIEDVVATHEGDGSDYTSNTLLRTYPDGLDIEVMTLDALRRAGAVASRRDEREHVTVHLYRHPELYRLGAHVGRDDLEDERWTIDTADDLESVGRMLIDHPEIALAPWRSISSAIGVERPKSGRCVLHVARPGPGFGRPRDAEIFGTGHPEGGSATALRPGHRTWAIHHDEEQVGQCSVDVVAGRGALHGWIEPRCRDERLDSLPAAIEQRLIADLQVIDLTLAVTAGRFLHRTFSKAGWSDNGLELMHRRLRPTVRTDHLLDVPT